MLSPTNLVFGGDAAFRNAVSQLQIAEAALKAASRSGSQAAAAQAQSAIYDLNNTIAQRLQVLGGEQRVTGRVLVQNAGEVAIPLTFPIIFTEEPGFWFGGVMDQGQAPEINNFPSVSAVILRWALTKFGSVVTYTGATLGVVTTGPADQRMYVHWHVSGKGISKDQDPTGVTAGASQ